ncbi:hypothetical protein DX928_23575 [Bacillus swezeyi]|uniref:Uncharacterized protein n=1 Tax=Bacillus swezeyi TaxID=1925020 RepID=A0A5M8RGK9_9BACI|nr:hypothetical protein DX927_23335 [Bacillus swezeyi]KAA6471549.1 hypothetical protein DX928_23575 [Bacillus swezeyi]
MTMFYKVNKVFMIVYFIALMSLILLTKGTLQILNIGTILYVICLPFLWRINETVFRQKKSN